MIAAVLLSFHLPLADFRSFIPNSGKLSAPDWPFPSGRGFVRGFGGVKLRKRGGLPDFIGEDILCDASGALKLETGYLRYGSKHSEFRCKHRRLFHDGLCFTRLEIGFTSTKYSKMNAVHTECALKNLLTIQVHPKPPTSSGKPRLSNIGRYISSSYLLATTSKRASLAPDSRWVMTGRPLILLEYHKGRHEHAMPPAHAKNIPLPPLLHIELNFIWLNEGGNEIPAWLIGSLPQSNQRTARDLRLYLARHHAERECLARVLNGLALGIITPKRGTPESKNLQQYLRDSIKRLEKLSLKQQYLFQTTEPINLANEAIDHIQRGKSHALHTQAIAQLTKLNVRPSIIKATQRVTVSFRQACVH